jgi:hypothetical protein
MLMRAGLRSYMGGKIKEHIENEHKARELGQKAVVTRFIFLLRRYAKQHGQDMSKFL